VSERAAGTGPEPDAPPAALSAARLAEELGDRLPGVETVSPAAARLVAATRELVAAVTLTTVDDTTLEAVAASLQSLTATLAASRRDTPLFLVRHPDGRVESLLQAGSGRLNPQAPPVEWVERPTEPPPGSPPVPATVRARCTFTAAHAGSPSRVHGGVLALVLDEVLGNAVTASGVSGMTVALEVSFKDGTPFGVPVEVVGRYAGHEGRKSTATGEVLVDGVATAVARAVYVGERR
jgi:acyl-coenzyme A thioesterase PaaI-like protein